MDFCMYLMKILQITNSTIFFKQRVIDVHVYIQEWHGCLERNQVLLSYKYCKTYFNYESYLFKHCRTVFGVIFLDYECLFCL